MPRRRRFDPSKPVLLRVHKSRRNNSVEAKIPFTPDADWVLVVPLYPDVLIHPSSYDGLPAELDKPGKVFLMVLDPDVDEDWVEQAFKDKRLVARFIWLRRRRYWLVEGPRVELVGVEASAETVRRFSHIGNLVVVLKDKKVVIRVGDARAEALEKAQEILQKLDEEARTVAEKLRAEGLEVRITAGRIREVEEWDIDTELEDKYYEELLREKQP